MIKNNPLVGAILGSSSIIWFLAMLSRSASMLRALVPISPFSCSAPTDPVWNIDSESIKAIDGGSTRICLPSLPTNGVTFKSALLRERERPYSLNSVKNFSPSGY